MGQTKWGLKENQVDLKPGQGTRHTAYRMVLQVLNHLRGEGCRQKKKPGQRACIDIRGETAIIGIWRKYGPWPLVIRIPATEMHSPASRNY